MTAVQARPENAAVGNIKKGATKYLKTIEEKIIIKRKLLIIGFIGAVFLSTFASTLIIEKFKVTGANAQCVALKQFGGHYINGWDGSGYNACVNANSYTEGCSCPSGFTARGSVGG